MHNEYSEDELYHYGVKGMKWGVRRARQTVTSLRKKIAKRREQKLAKKQAKLDKKIKMTQEEFDRAKKKAIESGSAEDVLKFQGYLSTQELKTAADRLKLEAEIAGRKVEHVSKGKKFVDDTLNAMQKTNEFTDKGITLWNNGAKIANSLLDYDLPVIDGTRKSDQRSKKAAEQHKERMQRIAEYGDIDTVIANLDKLNGSQTELAAKRFANRVKIKGNKTQK